MLSGCHAINMIIIAILWLGLASCSNDDENVNQRPSDGESGSAHETFVKPELDDEAIQFVGIWQGVGPSGTGVKDGIWKFNNDGTYHWLRTEKGLSDQGKWHYNAESKLLITDSKYDITWKVMDVTNEEWVGTMVSTSNTHTYKRQTTSPIKLGSAYVADFKERMLRVQFTIANYLYTTDKIICGICYGDSTETDRKTFRKIYATTEFADVTSFQDGTGTFDVTISDLRVNGKYRLHAFLINDKDTTYSAQLRAISVTPPDSTVYMGAMNGNEAVFWFDDEKSVSRGLNSNFVWSLPMPEDFSNIYPVKSFEMVQPYSDNKDWLKVTSARNGNSIHFSKYLYQTNYYLTNKTQGETWYYSRFVSYGQGVWGVDTYGLSWKKDWDEREYGAVKRKYVTRIIAGW